MTPEDSTLAALAKVLAARGFREPPDPSLPRAAVAVLLRPGGDGLELLLIRRAERAGDPWSGHMALPGGREQADDAGPADTAARETREEVGIDVAAGGRLLGALEPVWPQSARAPRIVVRPFVFAVPPGAEAVGNEEVDAAVWVPLEELMHPGAVTEHLFEVEGIEPMRFPAFGTRGYVVWGLTHRILTTFLELYARAAAPPE
ncbi:MAG TPA: CoA pyrophosphatase [Longimicrobium sp.]|nr:CoA pyrophosphatase [Longimicrobium sp.]